MRDKVPVVTILQQGTRLSDTDIRDVFASASPETKWYKAILQILGDHRHERAVSAAGFMNENNALGMAGCNGAYDILSTLILDLERQRQAAQPR